MNSYLNINIILSIKNVASFFQPEGAIFKIAGWTTYDFIIISPVKLKNK